MRIAVAGGTGVVGRHVVEKATQSGHDVIAVSRSTGVDLVTGVGLAEAIRGADAVIDVTSHQTLSSRASTTFFGSVTENLLAAERAAGDIHHVALSIVGAQRAPYGYYAGKALQERLVTDSHGPWSLLRATQFHEFAAQVLEQAKVLGRHVVPVMRSQPVAAREVADALVDIVENRRQGVQIDLAGPQEERMAQLSRSYLRAEGSAARVWEVRLPGALGRAMSGGGLLPGPEARLGNQTFGEWLAGQNLPGPRGG